MPVVKTRYTNTTKQNLFLLYVGRVCFIFITKGDFFLYSVENLSSALIIHVSLGKFIHRLLDKTTLLDELTDTFIKSTTWISFCAGYIGA